MTTSTTTPLEETIETIMARTSSQDNNAQQQLPSISQNGLPELPEGTHQDDDDDGSEGEEDAAAAGGGSGAGATAEGVLVERERQGGNGGGGGGKG